MAEIAAFKSLPFKLSTNVLLDFYLEQMDYSLPIQSWALIVTSSQ